MRARLGFVLFLLVFAVAAIAVPVVERMSRLLQQMLQSFSDITGRFILGARLVAKKVTTVEWKSLIQKA